MKHNLATHFVQKYFYNTSFGDLKVVPATPLLRNVALMDNRNLTPYPLMVIPCVWFGFRLEAILGDDRGASKIVAYVKSGQIWPENKHVALATKVQSKFLIHSVVESINPPCPFRVGVPAVKVLAIEVTGQTMCGVCGGGGGNKCKKGRKIEHFFHSFQRSVLK